MPRLIDLGLNWPLQYATESTLFDPSLYPEIPSRLARLDGYLGKTSAALVVCARKPEDWASQPDPWRALQELLARVEAEFSGRLLIGPDDLARWKDDPWGLTWAVLGVELTDGLIRSPEDLDRIPSLVKRGVRGLRIRTSDEEGADLGLLETLSDTAGRGVTLALDLPAENPRRLRLPPLLAG